MKDTIGAHLAESVTWSEIAGRQEQVLLRVPANDPSRKAFVAGQSRSAGFAAGHAFRAAEIAYDIGIVHGFVITGNGVARKTGSQRRFKVER